jgi:hypothetical protein
MIVDPLELRFPETAHASAALPYDKQGSEDSRACKVLCSEKLCVRYICRAARQQQQGKNGVSRGHSFELPRHDLLTSQPRRIATLRAVSSYRILNNLLLNNVRKVVVRGSEGLGGMADRANLGIGEGYTSACPCPRGPYTGEIVPPYQDCVSSRQCYYGFPGDTRSWDRLTQLHW